jgi:hypothetical protein
VPAFKLSPVSYARLVERLRQLGFEGPYMGGKHPYMIKGDLVLTNYEKLKEVFQTLARELSPS